MNKATKAQLKEVKELLREKKLRDKTGLFVIEGEKITRDIISKGYYPEFILISSSFSENPEKEDLLNAFSEEAIEKYVASDSDFEKVSSLKSSQGILAVMPKKEYTKDVFTGSKHNLIVLADGVQDPGNLGTLIRSSAAFEADCVLLMGDAADIFNPKVIRASAGAIFDVPVVNAGLEDLRHLKEIGYKLFVSSVDSGASKTVDEIASMANGCIVAFGSEGQGISNEVKLMADEYFHIPINENTESLNVSAAVAVSLYAIFRRG